MNDFDEALRARLANNEQIRRDRADAEVEMERAAEQARVREEEAVAARSAHHAALAARLKDLADQLKASRPDSFIVRSGWTASGEEFVARMSTRQMHPKRTLFIEVDRDDDEVLARWTSEIGNKIEVWRLEEVSEAMLATMVLQVADDGAWTGDRPPPFPT